MEGAVKRSTVAAIGMEVFCMGGIAVVCATNGQPKGPWQVVAILAFVLSVACTVWWFLAMHHEYEASTNKCKDPNCPVCMGLF